MQTDIHHLSNRKKLLCIEARNRHVEKGLKSLYENSVDGELKVFCVSNSTYDESAYQQETGMDQRLRSISGIPELRKFCYFLSADSRLRDAKSFLQATLPSLIASISMHSKDEESLLQKPGGPTKFDASRMTEIRDAVRNRFQRRSIYLPADGSLRSCVTSRKPRETLRRDLSIGYSSILVGVFPNTL